LVPLTNVSFGITNGLFHQDDPGAADFGWTTRGDVTVTGGVAELTEGELRSSALMQPFFVPPDAEILRFTIFDAVLGSQLGKAPDAFQVALLDPHTLLPLAGTADGIDHTDALLNIQSDGTYYAGSRVTISGIAEAGGILGDGGPRRDPLHAF
jgi:hypothetical protein